MSDAALMGYQDELNHFFDILQFEKKRSLQFAEYSEATYQKWKNYQPDVDEFLYSIIRSSRIINAIENEPEYWDYVQQKILSKEQIDKVTHYREKFGLSRK